MTNGGLSRVRRARAPPIGYGSAMPSAMPVRTCLLLAIAVGGLGLSLRTLVPVRPVDEAFREVIRFYDALVLPPR